jgi:hypothetical protein
MHKIWAFQIMPSHTLHREGKCSSFTGARYGGILSQKQDLMLRFIITSLLFQKEMPNILIN